MKKYSYLNLILFVLIFDLKAQTSKVLFETEYGNFKVKLYDYTPKHRDLFIEAIKNDVYKDALFNRIIKNFVVQGGEHDVDIEKKEAKLSINERVRFPAEFHRKAIHKTGALGAGRDDNAEKSSFLNQIYFIVGKKVTAEELEKIENKKGIQYTKKQKKIYLKQGGQPRLDNDYTIFGEVYDNLDVLQRISKVKTDQQDYPLNKIVFKMRLL